MAPVVQITRAENKPVLFLFHWAGGNVDMYHHLASHLDSDLTIHGITARGLHDSDPPHLTLQEMASDYIKDIRDIQPEGPYILAGASMGGKIAYEMACQMQKQGLKTGLVAMFDARILPVHPQTSIAERVHIHARNLDHASIRRILSYLAGHTRSRLRRWIYRFFIRRGHPLPWFVNRLGTITYIVSRNYRPGPYSGRVILFRASHLEPHTPANVYDAWNQLCLDGLRVIPVEGSHTSLLEEPGARNLASALLAVVQESLHSR